jgi:hypothetical protein
VTQIEDKIGRSGKEKNGQFRKKRAGKNRRSRTEQAVELDRKLGDEIVILDKNKFSHHKIGAE